MVRKSKEDIEILFDQIIKEIAVNGKSLLKAIAGKMSAQKFYELLKDDEKVKKYARACDDRADLIAEEILTIADEGSKKDNAEVQRDRLRIDSRKWLLSKLHPKKYGDKVDITSGDKPFETPTIIIKRFNKDE
jgi:hypothetical protein